MSISFKKILVFEYNIHNINIVVFEINLYRQTTKYFDSRSSKKCLILRSACVKNIFVKYIKSKYYLP